MIFRPILLSVALIAGCRGDKAAPDSDTALPPDSGDRADDSASTGPVTRWMALKVRVTLDGAPVEGATVMQGGNPARWTTDAAGEADITFDRLEPSRPTVLASHPDARIDAIELDRDLEDLPEVVELDLIRFDTTDNTAYVFQDPGVDGDRNTTEQCGHCHRSFDDDWAASAHRYSAQNVTVQDLFAGAAAAYADRASCADAGGAWWEGAVPGSARTGERCYLGAGVLPSLNPGCGVTEACDGPDATVSPTALGACADCHAPGIDGVLGGRSLLEATGLSYEYGVHCDVCHKVESVDLDAPAGVAGRLHILRPSEPSPSPVLGDYAPLTFGPYDDVANPRMGSVARDLYREPDLCAGCHQLDSPSLVPGVTVDTGRWPDGLLPVQSTYAEWSEGPMSPGAPCQSCHMPADALSGNSIDLERYLYEEHPDIASGWLREPGAVRRHAWFGPRYPGSPLPGLAAGLQAERSLEGDALRVSVTVKNVGAGHAIPTGEPMRHLVLLVEARCDGEALLATGGDAVPDLGGALDQKLAGEDWTRWPGAQVGEVLRVVKLGGWRDYTGPLRFGDGSFSAEEKGMREEEVAGQATITAVDGDLVTLDAALPEGDLVWRGQGSGLPADGDPVTAVAGAPGFAFGRVMLGPDGDRFVPHFLAVDVASDNRIPPQQSVTTTHQFKSPCADPTVHAALLYRAYGFDLAGERGWAATERLLAELWL